jgi:hypothetical protein
VTSEEEHARRQQQRLHVAEVFKYLRRKYPLLYLDEVHELLLAYRDDPVHGEAIRALEQRNELRHLVRVAYRF